ncbi:hypothetical protein FPSE5266_04709 [Fusarium pseudograminearum]|nr:hypothetical protein FPSE5266_04709 [Fusarium pseudograminearum]
MGKLCEHCAIILSLQVEPEAWSQDFPLRSIDDYAPLQHFRTVKELIESAENCRLCDFIEASWSLPALHKRYPDIKEQDYGSLELEFKITKAVSDPSGVSCNFIGGDIIVPWHSFADSFKVTITTCRAGTDVSQLPIWDCKELTKEDRIKTIKSWYTECSSQHAGCTINFRFWARSMGKDPSIIRDHIKIIEAGITWTGEPMVSDIVSSTMIVEGPVRQMRLRLDPRTKNFNPPFMNVGNEEPDFSETPVPWRCPGRFDLEDEREDDLFTCLLVRSVSPESRDSLAYPYQETFLLLVPVSTSEDTAYNRVGLAMIRGDQSEFASAETKKIRLL